MRPKLFPNRVAALLAAEAATMARGYDAETARKYAAAFAVRRFGETHDQWEAWYLHHHIQNHIYRRPIAA